MAIRSKYIRSVCDLLLSCGSLGRACIKQRQLHLELLDFAPGYMQAPGVLDHRSYSRSRRCQATGSLLAHLLPSRLCRFTRAVACSSNASKIARARAEAAKRDAVAVGGGGAKGIAERTGKAALSGALQLAVISCHPHFSVQPGTALRAGLFACLRCPLSIACRFFLSLLLRNYAVKCSICLVSRTPVWAAGGAAAVPLRTPDLNAPHGPVHRTIGSLTACHSCPLALAVTLALFFPSPSPIVQAAFLSTQSKKQLQEHQEAKHPKDTFEKCFPDFEGSA